MSATNACTAHVDTFARDHLPPPGAWPEFLLEPPVPRYAARINVAAELLDLALARGQRERVAIIAPAAPPANATRWTYAELDARANRIARVLVDDMGLVPGNRVLLRAPNSPMHAACWFGVMKAGGIAVGTMPLLRSRELIEIVNKARISHALCDHRLLHELELARPQCPTLAHVLAFGSADAPLEARMATRPATFQAIDTAA